MESIKRTSAYERGRRAFNYGQIFNDNPYIPNSQEYMEWDHGYYEASNRTGETNLEGSQRC